MKSGVWKPRLVLASVSVLLSLTPLAFSPEAGIGTAAAECPTCCYEATSYCIVCGTKACIVESNYYQLAGNGPCPGEP